MAENESVQSYPTRIKVERTMIYPSYEDAPDEIFVQEWRYGVVYKGTIPKVSFVQYEPNKAYVTYEGFIYYDPSVTPNFTQFIK